MQFFTDFFPYDFINGQGSVQYNSKKVYEASLGMHV